MRYVNVESTVFNTPDGRRVVVKQRRRIPEYDVRGTYRPKETEALDEIASRERVFGRNGEAETYKLVDANAEKLLQAHFDLSRVDILRIPVP